MEKNPAAGLELGTVEGLPRNLAVKPPCHPRAAVDFETIAAECLADHNGGAGRHRRCNSHLTFAAGTNNWEIPHNLAIQLAAFETLPARRALHNAGMEKGYTEKNVDNDRERNA